MFPLDQGTWVPQDKDEFLWLRQGNVPVIHSQKQDIHELERIAGKLGAEIAVVVKEAIWTVESVGSGDVSLEQGETVKGLTMLLRDAEWLARRYAERLT